jgi:hypothetical protein
MARYLRAKADTTMNRKETSILVAESYDECLTFNKRVIGYSAIVFSNIILRTTTSIIAPPSQIRDPVYKFEADQPLLDLFERDARSPRT